MLLQLLVGSVRLVLFGFLNVHIQRFGVVLLRLTSTCCLFIAVHQHLTVATAGKGPGAFSVRLACRIMSSTRISGILAVGCDYCNAF